ncbi:hypothetical protein [Neisseria sp. DTU_2021_1001991_1_SI_NGA_ILE_055]|uniref:hypothetical protein n=1 Tax=Neisseria sp. DTU_2021_1001991_1_SI_NGA_ILE_055 TaxID=3077590 RepID=UPI0028EA9E62|nr:hypothetical protein [Neisseria sp. DTU_2021_1001991_1_SI_NGA_ILE_055]WNS82918.1 hypothetical protein RRV97_07960 [Neisseria sp. DTU_2021_1001991_1_SI_NGA_ILE_055]
MKEIYKMKSWFSNTFPEYKKLPQSGKFMAWLTFVQGVVWLILASIQSVQGLINNMAWAVFFGILLFILGVLALSAAWNAFKFREVGFKRMIYVYTPCLLQIAFASDVFSFVFYIDSVLKLWFSLTVNKLSIGINFAAILFIVLAGRNCRHLKMVSQNTDKNVEPLEQVEQGQETQS